MGHILFSKNQLFEELKSLFIGKVGLSLTNKEILNLTKNSFYKEYLIKNKNGPIRMESNEVECIYYFLLNQLGYDVNVNKYSLISTSINEFLGTQEESLAVEILKNFADVFAKNESKDYQKLFDTFIDDCFSKYSLIGMIISTKIVKHIVKMYIYSPYTKTNIIS